MKWLNRFIYSLFVFIAGWLFNFIFDIQFALGVTAGWLMREGYDNVARTLLNFLNLYLKLVTKNISYSLIVKLI